MVKTRKPTYKITCGDAVIIYKATSTSSSSTN
jgi:hypothetical protein